MYAIIESCGKQYKVAEGDTIFFEKLKGKENIIFEKILLISDNENIVIGTPYVKGLKVQGQILGNTKSKKIIVFKMKAKKNYKRKYGHKQNYTKVLIKSIIKEW